MRKKHLTTLILFILPIFAFAQTAAELDTLLETNEITVGVTARFALGTVGLTPAGLSGVAAVNDAYQTAFSRGWVQRGQDEAISMQEAAFLIMNVFEIKGGIMYNALHNPRYAYREMVYQKLIPGRSYANMKVTGRQFLQVLNMAIDYAGDR